MSLSHYSKPKIKYDFCTQRLNGQLHKNFFKTERHYISKGINYITHLQFTIPLIIK